MWFDIQAEGMFGMYDVYFNNQEDAKDWIKKDIEHRKKMADNRTIECIPFHTRTERIQNLIDKK